VGYATTVMKQVGPSYAVGYNIIEERSATSQTNRCQRALRASYATKLQKEGSINVDIADVVREFLQLWQRWTEESQIQLLIPRQNLYRIVRFQGIRGS